jgi:hypothetical protein
LSQPGHWPQTGEIGSTQPCRLGQTHPKIIKKTHNKKIVFFYSDFLWVYSLAPESRIIPYFVDCTIFTNARVGNIHSSLAPESGIIPYFMDCIIFTNARVGNIHR